MIFLPDTNACISLLRRRTPSLMARWQSTRRYVNETGSKFVNSLAVPGTFAEQ